MTSISEIQKTFPELCSSGYFYIEHKGGRSQRSPLFGDVETLLHFAPEGAGLYYREYDGTVTALPMRA